MEERLHSLEVIVMFISVFGVIMGICIGHIYSFLDKIKIREK